MTIAQKRDDVWVELQPGAPVWNGEDVASYDTVMTWSVADQEAFGVYETGAGWPPPAGQVIVSSAIVEEGGRPVRVNTFGPEPQAPVPGTITPLQFRRAVRQFGMKPTFDAFVAELDDEDRETIEYATAIRRDDPLIEKARVGLNWTKAQVDRLFRIGDAL